MPMGPSLIHRKNLLKNLLTIPRDVFKIALGIPHLRVERGYKVAKFLLDPVLARKL